MIGASADPSDVPALKMPIASARCDAGNHSETAFAAAGHVEVGAAIREFFNADLVAREIGDKGIPAEMAALAEADAVVHGIWEGRFNNACQRHPVDARLPGLHARVMRDIRESVAFPENLHVGPVHRCGLMHRVVQDRRAGWVTHWRTIAAEE